MNIDPKTVIGHVHLKVANIESSLKFYRDILGFEVQSRIGDQAVFLSAGGYHHHIGLNTWESKDGMPAPLGHTGLYHVAILLPSRKALAETVNRILAAKYPVSGSSDHGVSEAVYLDDPDGNGIELYCDRPQEQWLKDEKGEISMVTKYLDIDQLIGEELK